MLDALKNQDLKALAGHMTLGNVLETVTIPAYPVIQKLKDAMIRGGALATLMSGSGPTVFGIFDSRQAAKRAYGALKRGHLAKQVFLTTPYNIRRNGNE
jgi:4-diphosphocytidyl-2-C-methyl-D-erythritol kinase